MKEADIVVTNPPFSLFREYVAQLFKYGKEFLIIGSVNAITYKEFFPMIRDDRVWMGASIHSGDRTCCVPDSYPLNAAGCGIDENGRKFIRVKGVRWWTNLDYPQRHEKLPLYKKYSAAEFPKYVNYDAIEVAKTADIPYDYDGVMGVPITFMDKHNPEQFEIIGQSLTHANMDVIKARLGKAGGGPRFYVEKDGKLVRLYDRILIRQRKPQ